jgi:hypothetical protein
MFGLLRKWREAKAQARADAERLIAEHGGQAKQVLREQIKEFEARGEPTKELWAVMREVRRLAHDDGLDTATRYTERP